MPERPPLDEVAPRRPDFRGGVKVRFADGSELHVPLPRVRYTPDDSEAGVAEVWDLGAEYAALRRAVLEATGLGESLRAEFRLVLWLLGLNYDLPPGRAGDLLQFGLPGESDEDHVRLREELMAVALGREPSPKAQGGGSD